MPEIRGGPGGTFIAYSRAETNFDARAINNATAFTGSTLDVRGYRSVLLNSRIEISAGAPTVQIDVLLLALNAANNITLTLAGPAQAVPFTEIQPAAAAYQAPTGLGAVPFTLQIPMVARTIQFRVSNDGPAGSILLASLEVFGLA